MSERKLEMFNQKATENEGAAVEDAPYNRIYPCISCDKIYSFANKYLNYNYCSLSFLNLNIQIKLMQICINLQIAASSSHGHTPLA